MRFLIILLMQMVSLVPFSLWAIDAKAIKVEETYKKHTDGPNAILVLRVWLPNDPPTKANFLEVCKFLSLKYKDEPRLEANIFSSEEATKGFSEL